MKNYKNHNKMKTCPKFPPSVKKILLILLFFIGIKGITFSEEYFDKEIVETFRETIMRVEYHYAGVDLTGDGFADLFIMIEGINADQFYRRLAGLLREGAKVSIDDTGKYHDRFSGNTYIDPNRILEINGRSVLQIFPNNPGDFPFERRRQQRLQNQNNEP
jgi:hypothetical protein